MWQNCLEVCDCKENQEDWSLWPQVVHMREKKKYEFVSLLGSPIEKVKVPKLEANPLSRLSDELVRTVQRFRVGAGVRRREQLLATVPEKRECEETIRGIRDLAKDFFLRIFQNFFVGFSTFRGTCFREWQSCTADSFPQLGLLAPRSSWTGLEKKKSFLLL